MGPSDGRVDTYAGVIEGYEARKTLAEKKLFIEQNADAFRTLKFHNELFRKKMNFSLANIREYSRVGDLDAAITDVLVMSEQTPDMDTWNYRAYRATHLRLNELADEYPQESAGIDELHRQYVHPDCESQSQAWEKRPIPQVDKSLEDQPARISPESLLINSGTFTSRIMMERSSGQVCAKAAEWICHLLKTHSVQVRGVDEVLELVGEIVAIRPYPGLRLFEELSSRLMKLEPDTAAQIDAGVRYLQTFVQQRKTAIEEFNVHASGISCSPGEAMLLYGYSDAVMSVLNALSRRTSSRPVVYVAECRNRTSTEEGLTYAIQARELGLRRTLLRTPLYRAYSTMRREALEGS
jgi:hypothetical protein